MDCDYMPPYSVQEVQTANSIVSPVIERGQFDSQGNRHPWTLSKAEVVKHTQFQQDYQDKKSEMLGCSSSGSGCDLNDKFGFFVETEMAPIKKLLHEGLLVGSVKFNTIGFSKRGVYITTYHDVCLRHFFYQNPTIDTVRLVIFKYFLGRNTRCVPKAKYATEIIEPSCGFDSHRSVMEPSTDDNIQQQFEKSQVFLYEIVNNAPVVRPRQLVPCAVLTYKKDKIVEAEILQNEQSNMMCNDVEDSSSQCSNNSFTSSKSGDRFANNPQLKKIVDAINSRPINSAPVLPPRKRNPHFIVPTKVETVPVAERLASNPQLKAIVDKINSRPQVENAPMLPPRSNNQSGKILKNNVQPFTNQGHSSPAYSQTYGYGYEEEEYNDQTDESNYTYDYWFQQNQPNFKYAHKKSPAPAVMSKVTQQKRISGNVYGNLASSKQSYESSDTFDYTYEYAQPRDGSYSHDSHYYDNESNSYSLYNGSGYFFQQHQQPKQPVPVRGAAYSLASRYGSSGGSNHERLTNYKATAATWPKWS